MTGGPANAVRPGRQVGAKLVILLLAFGSIVAVGLPLVVAIAARFEEAEHAYAEIGWAIGRTGIWSSEDGVVLLGDPAVFLGRPAQAAAAHYRRAVRIAETLGAPLWSSCAREALAELGISAA